MMSRMANVVSMNSMNIHDVNDMQSYKLGDAMFDEDCRRPGLGGIQSCLPAAHHVASSMAWHGPASASTPQDPREGPSLAR